MALVMTFSYIGAFVDPVGNMHNMPLAIVNEDAGISGQPVNLGQQVVAAVTAGGPQLGDAVRWTQLASREEALARLGENKYYAALVLPADYSARLASLSRPETPAGSFAEIEVLTNPASGSVAGSESQAIATAAVTRISKAASAQLVQALGAASSGLAPERAPQIADPVRPKLTVAQPIGTKNARGLAPLYFAVMMTLAGFIGGNFVHVGVEFAAGRIELDFLAQRFSFRRMPAAARDLWLVKLGLINTMSVLAGALITWMAVGILSMDSSRVIGLALFAILGTAAIANLTLFFLTAFGTAGLVLGVLFTTIFGVPSAGGVYPLEMLPAFFRFLSGWLPLRYMTDGTRALMFFDGRGAAGLDPAIWVLLSYAGAAALLGGVTAYVIDRARLSQNASP
jgi:YhgE/Pip-like protein